MGNNETKLKQQVKNNFINDRMSCGLPEPPEQLQVEWSRANNGYYVYEPYQFPHSNIKGIYMKYPYTGKITLEIGGAKVSEVYDNDGIDKNMLDILDCKLPLHLVKYHTVILRTDKFLLLPSDIRFEYSDQHFEEGYTQQFTDSDGNVRQIIYKCGLFGMNF
jgi:hypothetical protein